MTNRSPYGPDYSLLHAVLVLLGSLGMVAAGVYLVTTIDNPLPDQSQIQLAETLTQAPSRSPAPQCTPASRRMLAPGDGSVPVGGGVPAWAGSGGLAVSSGTPAPQGTYHINPDFDHARLGAPAVPSGGGPPSGAAIVDAGSPGESGSIGGTPETAFSAPDMNGRSVGGSATSGGTPQWRSEARALASRSRALSNELGWDDRQDSREASRSRSEDTDNEPSGEATTASERGASTSSTPGTPDRPDQVPLGGAEWLAAAGAAYALNRLREKDGDESEDDA